MNKKKGIIIGVLAIALVMVVGYALFSDTLTINGTATAKGEFDIEFNRVNSVSEIGSKGATAEISEDKNTLTINAPKLEYPSSYVEVDVTGHGTIKVTPDHAGTGDTVTITAAPDDGYELHTLTVTGQSGDPVEIRPLGGGKRRHLGDL